MNRREFIRLTIAGAMTPGLFHLACEKEKDKPKWLVPKDAPNVLFIVLDLLHSPHVFIYFVLIFHTGVY